jgi:hypothetical protein
MLRAAPAKLRIDQAKGKLHGLMAQFRRELVPDEERAAPKRFPRACVTAPWAPHSRPDRVIALVQRRRREDSRLIGDHGGREAGPLDQAAISHVGVGAGHEVHRCNQNSPHPRRERQARTRAASCGIEKGLVR